MDQFDWNDYASWPTKRLIDLHKEVKATPEGEGCDNLAPGTCCHDCNISLIVEELTERLSKPA